jgi:hypothetical protein
MMMVLLCVGSILKNVPRFSNGFDFLKLNYKLVKNQNGFLQRGTFVRSNKIAPWRDKRISHLHAAFGLKKVQIPHRAI